MEFALLHVEDVAVVCDDNGNDGDAGLDGEVEGALFEGEEVWGVVVGAGAFGEDVDGLAVLVHLLGGSVKGGDGLGAGFALDENGFAEGHCEEEGVLLARGCACDKEGSMVYLLNQPRIGT